MPQAVYVYGMAPSIPLPLADEWEDVDSYLDALLSFTTSTPLFLNLCGGVHILDFLTSDPDLYTTLLPEDWRQFFACHELYDILDLLLTDDVSHFNHNNSGQKNEHDQDSTWQNGPVPPPSLIEYIRNIRRLCLKRDFTPTPTSTENGGASSGSTIPLRLAVGMKPKKLHEVEHFSSYVDSFATSVSETRQEPVTHIVDFGSGQNYLGRTLASSYNRHIIAIERKHDFIKGAQGMDIHAKLAQKKVNMAKKGQRSIERSSKHRGAKREERKENGSASVSEQVCETCPPQVEQLQQQQDDDITFKIFSELDISADDLATFVPSTSQKPKAEEIATPRGSMDYIEHEIKDGYLEPIIQHVVNPIKQTTNSHHPSDARVLVVSLHSCGNLLHHGVRSLIQNPSVVAIAMVGCCYNLLTERLGPATYKLPILRHMHQRLSVGANEYDPHGFPMSTLFTQYPYPGGTGIKLNITARMMACQAPYNWTREESQNFFTRHYYRALLQRIFVDKGVVTKPKLANLNALTRENSDDHETPLVIGALKKTVYHSFPSYAKAAMAKLSKTAAHKPKMTRLMDDISTEELEKYVAEYSYAKKNLSLVWTLMAFSAGVVEAMIVIDRWQFLREHMASGLVRECWVEPVFDYAQSPRNLVVIGIKN
ncbi:methyltransferase domain-containing protein [Talaromyces proteolyticus]|uniref:Methyltransferase domain-containing protein n=1 Tax=Talaromyces proteolyticus TaxID=1131652 RepID=A0AAD4KX62_9EURO|nr:methyltransferase domain-containing protein [Talaromyces proteolyticus]KAH8701935.1 methyltransferase domain-containing protein [Talaromyces proteolyticus]